MSTIDEATLFLNDRMRESAERRERFGLHSIQAEVRPQVVKLLSDFGEQVARPLNAELEIKKLVIETLKERNAELLLSAEINTKLAADYKDARQRVLTLEAETADLLRKLAAEASRVAELEADIANWRAGAERGYNEPVAAADPAVDAST